MPPSPLPNTWVGSEEGFVKLMNEYAANLSLKSTVFTNCTGEYDEEQITTANDIAVLMKYALSNSDFNRFFSEPGPSPGTTSQRLFF